MPPEFTEPVLTCVLCRAANKPVVSYLPRRNDSDRNIRHRRHEQYRSRAEDPNLLS